MGGTGRPVGPEGSGGGGSACFFLAVRWIGRGFTVPKAGMPAHNRAELRSKAVPIFFSVVPVLMIFIFSLAKFLSGLGVFRGDVSGASFAILALDPAGNHDSPCFGTGEN